MKRVGKLSSFLHAIVTSSFVPGMPIKYAPFSNSECCFLMRCVIPMVRQKPESLPILLHAQKNLCVQREYLNDLDPPTKFQSSRLSLKNSEHHLWRATIFKFSIPSHSQKSSFSSVRV